MRFATFAAFALIVALVGAGCSLGGIGEDEAIDLAAAVEDYKAYRSADLSDPAEDVALSADSQAEAEASRAAADFEASAKAIEGYGVTVVDNGDGTVTVTREAIIDDQTTLKFVLTRPKRPLPDDVRWDGGAVTEIVESATETRYVNDVSIGEADITVTWKLEAGSVYRYRMLRQGETLKPAGTIAVSTETEWVPDGTLVSKTVTYTGVGRDGSIVTRTFSVESVEIGGVSYRKLTSEDRDGYAIVKSYSPRIVEYYRPDDTLFLIVTHERVIGTGIVVTRVWYHNGAPVRTVEGTIRIQAAGGVVTMIREIGGRRAEITIEETESGYMVTRGDSSYTISMDSGVVTIVTADGEWTVTYGADGEAIVTQIR
jgi:hypothetical protein